MEKQYKSLGELVKKSGVIGAVRYKFLEMRDRSKVFNHICMNPSPQPLMTTAYNGNYVAAWDDMGILVYFNPNPNYPEDAYGSIKLGKDGTYSLVKLTEKEINKKIPINFANKIHAIGGTDHSRTKTNQSS
ncbi:MAG: hypothetical protein ABFQ65_00800 [Nanoarchaeota archaeon]